MSTRCNIKIVEGNDTIWLYHHHDGYPRYLGAFLLTKFYERFKDKTQHLGINEIANELIHDKVDDEFEPTTGMHGDIEFLYEINADTQEIKCFDVTYGKDGDYWKQTISTEPLDLIKESCAWRVTRSDKDNRDVWYLSRQENVYQDEDGNTIYFDTPQAAQDKALELMFKDFNGNLE